MITIKNVRNLLGEIETLKVTSEKEDIIDAAGSWTLFPAAIDVGVNSVNDWNEITRKAIVGGVTTVFNLSEFSQSLTKETLKAEKETIMEKLSATKVPLHHLTYFELSTNTIEELGKFKNEMAGIVIPKRLNFEDKFADRIFQLAAQENCIVVVNCVEFTKTRQAIDLAEKYSTQLLLLNISQALEIDYLREAKKRELLIFSAASVSGLQSHEYLWEAIFDKTIDLVASSPSHCECDMFLPTLLDGYNAKKITLEGIVEVMRTNAEKIFRLNYNNDLTLVDLEKVKDAQNGKKLKGWPCYTLIDGFAFPV